MPAQKTLVVQKLRQKHALSILPSIAQLPRATFYYHLKRMKQVDKYESEKQENFFGLLKSELLYLQEFQSMEHFKRKSSRHI